MLPTCTSGACLPAHPRAAQEQGSCAVTPTWGGAEHFNRDAFCRAFAAVLACATFLPAAGCFALVPLAATLPRTGDTSGASLDYDAASGNVHLKAQRRLGWGPAAWSLVAALPVLLHGWTHASVHAPRCKCAACRAAAAGTLKAADSQRCKEGR